MQTRRTPGPPRALGSAAPESCPCRARAVRDRMSERIAENQSEPREPPTAEQSPAIAVPSEAAELRGRLIFHGLLNNLGPVVAALTSLATVPVMLWGLGGVDYGLWIIVLSVSGLVMSLDLGLGLIITRDVARSAGLPEREPSRTARAAGGGLLVVGLAGWGAMTTIGVVSTLSGGFVRGWPLPEMEVFALVGVALFLDQVVQHGLAVLAGRQRFGLSNLVLAAGALTRMALIIGAVVVRGDLNGVAVAYSLAALATALFTTAAVQRVDPGHGVFSATFDLQGLRPQLRFGIGTLTATAAGAVLWQVHPLIIGTLIGPAAVVAYHVGMRPTLLLSEMSWRTAEVLVPAVSRTVSRPSDAARVGIALSSGVRWLTFIVTPVALVVAILAPALLRLWLPEVPAGTAEILRLGMVVVLLDAWSVAGMQVLWGLGRVDRIAAAMAASAVLAVVTDMLLIPVLGPPAAPLALLLGLFVMVSTSLPSAAAAAAVPVSGILVRDIAGLMPPAAACALGTTLAARAGGGADAPSVVLGALGGLTAYLLAARYAPALKEERTLVMRFLGHAAHRARTGLRMARARAKEITYLRSAWYLLIVLRRRLVYRSSATSASLNRLFEESPDPWRYTSAEEQARHEIAASLLAVIHESGGLERATEIGCAEGTFTAHLAPLCDSLLCLDVSEAALERARTRFAWDGSVRFRQFDLLRDPLPGPFTATVVMDVLTYFQSVSELRAIRGKIVDALEPGGWLLVGDVRQAHIYETTSWGRRLLCGGYWICEFVAAHPALRLIASDQTETHVFRLLRKEA